MVGWLSKSARIFLFHLGVSLIVAVCVLVLTEDLIFEFPPLKRAELSLTDLRFKQRGVNRTIRNSSNIVIVEISQESFKSLPEKWPWPRSYYTRLIRNLKRAGARAIGIDVLFSTSDSRDPHNDDDFRSAIRDAGGVVLAGKLEPEQHAVRLRSRQENYGNIFIDSTSSFGLVNAREDADGVLRRYLPFYYDYTQEKRLPTFALAVLGAYYHRPIQSTPEVSEGIFRYVERTIPQYDPTSFLINYYGPSGLFRRVNIADVLDDRDFQTVDEINHPGEEINTFDDPETGYLYDGTFTGKIVLVGSTMPEDKDLFPVTIAEGRQEGDNKMYGVEIHANVIQNIIDQNFIARQPRWTTLLIVFGLSLFTFVFTAGLKSIRTKYSSLIELLGVALIVAELFIVHWASLTLFTDYNFLADTTSAFLAIVISYIGSTVYSYVTERKQKVLIKSMFSRYVNPTIVDELVAHPEKLRLGGERKELTVFFSDIEHFTQISEKMPPEELVTILNEYLSMMTSIILSNIGTLDKYEGDAIVAFWGAPVPQSDHALRACRTAIQMQASLSGMRVLWKKEGKPALNVRIGINTGEVIVGNMGGATRFDYTVIGDSVNLGSRLESANKQYRTNIMISESTFRMVQSHVIARELDMLVVAGKTEPIRVYELMGMRDATFPESTILMIEQYTQGIQLYRQRCWKEAIEKFEAAMTFVPDDYPSHLYLERSQLYRSSPPPDDWNGVFILRTK